MGGDDDAARNGGETAKGAEGTLSAYIRIRAIGRCRAAKWSDRLSLKSARGLRVCRPALALIRRQTRSERSGWPSAGVESVHRRTDHRAWGGRIIKEACGLNGKDYRLCGWEERGDCTLAPTIGGRAAAWR